MGFILAAQVPSSCSTTWGENSLGWPTPNTAASRKTTRSLRTQLSLVAARNRNELERDSRNSRYRGKPLPLSLALLEKPLPSDDCLATILVLPSIVWERPCRA